MKYINVLPFKNLVSHPLRFTCLIFFSVLLSLVTFGLGLITDNLSGGLKSLEKRLGADIIVVPYESRTKVSIEDVLINGNRTSFYMSKSYLDTIRAIEGVEKASPQLFLSSISAGCCSVTLQIIGYDPQTDFTINSWGQESFKELKDNEILIGSLVSHPEDGFLKFYDVPCKVISQLHKTGTGLDNAVYTNINTIKAMIANASKLPSSPTGKVDADSCISSIMIKVQEGYDVEEVCNYINVHHRKVRAIKAKSLTTEVSNSINTISFVVRLLKIFVSFLCLMLFFIVFTMLINERKKEFAILRIMGVSKNDLSLLVIKEALIIGLTGGLGGIFLSLLIIIPFNTAISMSLKMPYLMTGVMDITLKALISLILSLVTALIASSYISYKIGKEDISLILKEDN